MTLITVKVGVPERPPIRARAMLDTGAGFTVLHTKLVQELKLDPCGYTWLLTPGNEERQIPLYKVRLQFPQKVCIDVEAGASAWERGDYMCFIGRDVLKYGMLMYDGTADSFTLAFK